VEHDGATVRTTRAVLEIVIGTLPVAMAQNAIASLRSAGCTTTSAQNVGSVVQRATG
jgi:hypothetical protein